MGRSSVLAKPGHTHPGQTGATETGGDLTDSGDSAQLPLKPYRSILEAEVAQAEEELRRPAHGLLVSGLLAGIGVGTSLFLMAIVLGGPTAGIPDPVRALLVANAFTVGFIVVILSRVDLFTEYTTIAILPVLTGRARVAQLVRLWGLVYAGNLVGAIAFAAFLVGLLPALGAATPGTFRTLADPMIRHGPLVTTASAILAGWLMGVLSWLIAAARDTTSQLVFVWLVAFTIGLGGLHHAITGAAEVAAALFAGEGATPADFGHFLLWTTLGNGIGGGLFALLIRYSLVIRHGGDSARRGRGRDRRRGD